MLTSQIVLLILVIMLGLYALFWLLGMRHNQRRGQAFLAALTDSTSAQMTVLQGPNERGFVAIFEPPPAPYYYLAAIFYPAPPTTYWMRPFLLERDQLLLRGILTDPPHNQLMWTKRQIPGVAAGYGPQKSLWRRRILDTANSEFSVRGPNSGALESIFRECFMRFGPLLARARLLGSPMIERRLRNTQLLNPEKMPVDIEIAVAAAKLPTEEISALVARTRALGRAALLH